jgi:hypothetical protein
MRKIGLWEIDYDTLRAVNVTEYVASMHPLLDKIELLRSSCYI